jgi:hypothetical protein
MVVMDLPNKILLNIVQKQHSDPIHTFFIEVEAIILCRIRICVIHATYQPAETAKFVKMKSNMFFMSIMWNMSNTLAFEYMTLSFGWHMHNLILDTTCIHDSGGCRLSKIACPVTIG